MYGGTKNNANVSWAKKSRVGMGDGAVGRAQKSSAGITGKFDC